MNSRAFYQALSRFATIGIFAIIFNRKLSASMAFWWPMLRWRQYSPAMKVLAIPLALCGCAFAVSLLTLGYIETAALYQPSAADAVFRHPHRVKGSIRYLTDWQERFHSIAYPAMLGALSLVAVQGYLLNRLRDRIEGDARRKRMDKIAASIGNLNRGFRWHWRALPTLV